MNISTEYMGLSLKSPLVVSSSRLTGDLNSIRKCIEAGAGAIVLKSIFEEQIRLEAESNLRNAKDGEMYYWFPEAKDRVVGMSVEASLEKYLGFITDLKKESDVPVISSINCVSHEEWPKFATAIEEAGADGIELNIAIFPKGKAQSSAEIEDQYVKIVQAVKKHVSIPVSVKLGYYFTNLFSLSHRLVEAGADGLVLFNRYFRPDINIETMEVMADQYLSSPEELNVPLRWIALLNGNNPGCDISASTGVHGFEGVVKQLLVGAQTVQLCSTVFIHGTEVIGQIAEGLQEWMKAHKFDSLAAFRGKALDKQTTDASFERIQYMRKNYD